MSVRTIEIPILSLTEPDSVRRYWGGMQYEDGATEIVFCLPEGDNENTLYRIDFNSLIAGWHPSENLSAEEGKIRRSIPKYISACGGEFQVTAVATLNGEVCYSYPALIYLTDVQKSEHSDCSVEENISEMEKTVRELADSALSSAELASEYKTATENARFSLEHGAEFIFLGGGAEQNLPAALVIDSQMSDESKNTVQNRVIKQYIDSQIAALARQLFGEADSDI